MHAFVDEDSFRGKFNAILKCLFELIGVSCDRLVCKSADTVSFVPPFQGMVQFLKDFHNNINE